MTLRAPPDDRDLDSLRSFGVVNLDKPPGPSAHQVAAWIRDATGQEDAEPDRNGRSHRDQGVEPGRGDHHMAPWARTAPPMYTIVSRVKM